MVLLRGFSQYPNLPTVAEIYKLNPAAIAAYPMYRGLAKLVGMKILDTGASIEDEFDTLVQHYADHDFFFVHVKMSDSAGEDGNFDAKVRVLEEVDELLPKIIKLDPDVLVVSGDHSTPALLKAHSWHPVPLILYSKWCRPDRVREFSEPACSSGALGRFPAVEVMSLAMANALKLAKFGA
jgi:2,3-bisphosphoglycerate-independent phosphoglycerate mutase